MRYTQTEADIKENDVIIKKTALMLVISSERMPSTAQAKGS